MEGRVEQFMSHKSDNSFSPQTMIKKLRVTVDGKSYEVTVEMPDETAHAAPPTSHRLQSSPRRRLRRCAPCKTPPPRVMWSVPLWAGSSPLISSPVRKSKQGQQLLTIETMKMNTFVLAPKAGKVAEVLVSVGDAVEEGRILARIA